MTILEISELALNFATIISIILAFNFFKKPIFQKPTALL